MSVAIKVLFDNFSTCYKINRTKEELFHILAVQDFEYDSQFRIKLDSLFGKDWQWLPNNKYNKFAMNQRFVIGKKNLIHDKYASIEKFHLDFRNGIKFYHEVTSGD